MLNKIIHYSLRNRLVILVLTGIIMVAGCFALLRAEVDIFPDLNAPTVVIMTEANGMASEEVEKLVTFPIETAVNGAAGVRRVRSSSTTGFSVVWVEFDWGTEQLEARQIVSEKIEPVGATLPEGVSAPVLGPQSSILGEILIIGLTVNDTTAIGTEHTTLGRLRSIADREIRPQLLALKGAAQVAVLGGEELEYRISLSQARMKNLGVTLSEVVEATESLNSNAAGGTLYDYGNEYIVKGTLTTSDPSMLEHTVVRSDASGTVTLGDIGQVDVRGKHPKLGVGSVETREAVLLTVTKQPGAGTIDLTEKIQSKLAELKCQLPADVAVSTDIFRQSYFIDASIGNLQTSLLEGALMVIIVLFFFMMNMRATAVSVVALPVSIIVTVLILRMLNITINTMTLGGIAIAIGSLVDDAIVDVENVYRHLRLNQQLPKEQRQPALRVVYEASKEVRTPIFNSSLIVVASFLPLFFLSGVEGRMLIPLGISFIIALAASTIVALTLTPVLCSLMLGSRKATAALERDPWLTRHMKEAYRRSLSVAIRHGKALLIGVAALCVISAGMIFTLGANFLPPFNEGSLTINVSTLPGISLEESDKIGRLAEHIILDTPEVTTVARKTGRAELDEHSLGINVSEIEAPYRLSDRSRNEMVRDLRSRLQEIPGANIEIGQPISHRIDAMLSGTEAQIAIKLFGSDLNELFHIGNQVKTIAQGVEGVTDINIEQQIERPQVSIRPRRDMLARYGITMNRFREFIEIALGGKVVSQVYDSSLPYDVTLKFDEESNSQLEAIPMLQIDSNQGKIPLSYVAEITSTTGPNAINREDIARRIVISANVDGRDIRSAVNDIRKAIETDISLPEGYRISYGGQFESEAKATRTLTLMSLLSILIIFLLLYTDFKSLSQSLLLLVNIPLAMIGGVWILVVCGSDLNIPAIIGFISLLGIATRNGMLLMNRYNILKTSGMALKERIYLGSVDRLTPIIMTALTSALALIPLALRGHVAGNEIQSPMAQVILGGLITSTLLNIYVVPVIYGYLEKSKSESK